MVQIGNYLKKIVSGQRFFQFVSKCQILKQILKSQNENTGTVNEQEIEQISNHIWQF
jgi:hypothetical protein